MYRSSSWSRDDEYMQAPPPNMASTILRMASYNTPNYNHIHSSSFSDPNLIYNNNYYYYNIPVDPSSSSRLLKDKSSSSRTSKFSSDNAVHIIPFVLLLCAAILWFFSNPSDVVVDVRSKRESSIAARIEGMTIEGVGDVVDGTDNIDGTQSGLLPTFLNGDSDSPKRTTRTTTTTTTPPHPHHRHRHRKVDSRSSKSQLKY